MWRGSESCLQEWNGRILCIYTVVMSMSVGESGCATVTGCWQLTNTSPSE